MRAQSCWLRPVASTSYAQDTLFGGWRNRWNPGVEHRLPSDVFELLEGIKKGIPCATYLSRTCLKFISKQEQGGN